MARARIRVLGLLGPSDASALENVEPDVFDRPVRPDLARDFLCDPRHHIVVAELDNRVIGFASAVHYVHPDKTANLWVNEIGVSARYRRQRLGSRLLAALLRRGREVGCQHAWVLTDRKNCAARRLFASVGGVPSESEPVMYEFGLRPRGDRAAGAS